MKRYIFLLMVCFCGFAFGQTAQIKTLQSSYKLGFVTKSRDSVSYQKIFFDSFPSTFKSFNDVYYWNEKAGKPNPLYDIANNHIDHFFNLKPIDNKTFIKKVISISINGHSEADAISYFQDNLHRYVTLHTKEFIEVLSPYHDKEIISIWTFYFDMEASTYRKKYYNELLKLVAPTNKKTIDLITIAYRKATKLNDPSNH